MTTVLYRADLDTPVGPFLLLADADGAVRASGFTADPDEVLGLLPRGGAGVAVRPAAEAPDGDPTAAALDALRRFFAGELTALDAVPVRQDADPERPVARMRVRLRAVGAGETRTYAGLAADAGLPRASRAAGQACSRNAAAPFVPCHRVLSTSGGLGGYRWGLRVKRALLDHERAHAGGAAGTAGPEPLPLGSAVGAPR